MAIAAGSCLLLSACGSSANSGTAPAGSGDGSAVSTEASKLFKQYQTPSGLAGLPAISKSIPTGKQIDFVICGPSPCVSISHYFTEAATTLGWHVKVINAGTTPSSIQAAMQQAVNDNPDGVVYEGLDTSLFTRQLDELKAKHIPVIADQTTDPSTPPDFSVIPGKPHYSALAQAMAASTVVAGGDHANVAFVSEPAFPIYAKMIDPMYKAAIKSQCPDCTLNEYQLPISAIGKNSGSLITNFVRAHPGTNVVINDQPDTSLGLSGALNGAGISGVKIITVYSTAANYSDLYTGAEFSLLPDPHHELAYLFADALARIFTGGSPQPDMKTEAPVVIWTKENLPTDVKGGEEPPSLPNYQSVFHRIWGK